MTDRIGPAPGRVELLDAWRGVAVLVMIVWHFRWDLCMMGFADTETMRVGAWLGVDVHRVHDVAAVRQAVLLAMELAKFKGIA